MICSMKFSIFEVVFRGSIFTGTGVFRCESILLISKLLLRSEEIFEFICKLVLEFWLLFTFTKVFASINVSCYWCCRLSYCSIILQRVPYRCDRIFLIFSLIDSSEISSSLDDSSLSWLWFESVFLFLIMEFRAILLLKSISYYRRSSATIANTGAKFILTFRGRYGWSGSLQLSSISVTAYFSVLLNRNYRGVLISLDGASLISSFFVLRLPPIISVGSDSACVLFVGELRGEFFIERAKLPMLFF